MQYTYSKVSNDGAGNFTTIPGRILNVRALDFDRSGNWTDVSSKVWLTSSNTGVLDLRLVGTTDDGGIQWYQGQSTSTGTTTLTATLEGRTAVATLSVVPAFVGYTGSGGGKTLTENDQGRLTAYMIAGKAYGSEHTGFAVSPSKDQWGSFVALANPPGDVFLAAVSAAESPNGYRAVVTTNNLGGAWVHLIDPTGNVKGPLMLLNPDLGVAIIPPVLTVTPDGDAHIWIASGGKVTRMIARYSDSTVATINSIPADTVFYHPVITVSPSGTVGIVSKVDGCKLNYAFDSVSSLTAIPSSATGTVTLSSCSATGYAYPGFSAAASTNEIAVAISYDKTTFLDSEVAFISIPKAGPVTTTILDEIHSFWSLGGPRIATYPSGELFTIWQTGDRGVQGAHRAAGSTIGAAFQVHAPSLSMGTPDVDGVYLRGNQRFLLAWYGEQQPSGDFRQFREYSASNGLGALQSFPFEVPSATNDTKLSASPFGISAISSYWLDSGPLEIYAVHNFLP